MQDHLASSFRSDQQVAEVCQVLCEHASMPGLWTAARGPTERAEELLKNERAGLSAGQAVIFLAAWELWDESRIEANPGRLRPHARVVRLGYILRALTGRHLAPLATLLVAMAEGPVAVDAWLDANRLPSPR